MKSYTVRFAPEAIEDLGRIFATLLPVAGERVARDFVTRLQAACLGLSSAPERGSLRNHVRPGLRVVGYRRQASIAFVVTDSDVLILRVLRRGADTDTLLVASEVISTSDDP